MLPLGIPDADIERVHRPIGLNIAFTRIAVVAEVLFSIADGLAVLRQLRGVSETHAPRRLCGEA